VLADDDASGASDTTPGSEPPTDSGPEPRMAARPPTHLYYAATWGNPVGVGASGTVFTDLSGYAKLPTTQAPFVVVNEFVAWRLASAAGLPVPPGALLGNHPDGVVGWVTLSYLASHSVPPPVSPESVVKSFPELAAGVVVFDFIIANTDRHAGNLALVTGPVLATGGPKVRERLEVFDHSHAVVNNGQHNNNQSPQDYLNALKDQFVIGNNCLLAHLTSAEDLLAWCLRLSRLLTDEVIRETCEEAAMITSGFTPDDASVLSDFLMSRRDTAAGVLRTHAAQFPAVSAADWKAA
jgi:hypothetical protein